MIEVAWSLINLDYLLQQSIRNIAETRMFSVIIHSICEFPYREAEDLNLAPSCSDDIATRKIPLKPSFPYCELFRMSSYCLQYEMPLCFLSLSYFSVWRLPRRGLKYCWNSEILWFSNKQEYFSNIYFFRGLWELEAFLHYQTFRLQN